ncbi:MAG TPA: LysR family transcriptional regulator [Chloroflexia bacterium]|nr:LysR family transcriptional regulator [Chloroflexia bacterium]
MELRQLSYFLAAAQTQNFSRAADICMVAESNLSRQINALEQELKTALFTRVKKRVILTSEGRQFAAFARNALEQLQEGQQLLARLSAGESSLVVIGCVEPLSSAFLPEILARFNRKYPAVQFRIKIGRTDELVELVEQGLLDMALVFNPDTRSELLIVKELVRQSLELVVSPDHSFASRVKTGVSLSEVAREPLIVLSERSRLRRTIDRIFSQRGYECRTKIEIESLEGLKQLVKYNVGISLLLPVIVRSEQVGPELVVVGVNDLSEDFIFALVYRRIGPLSTASREFIKSILESEITAD